MDEVQAPLNPTEKTQRDPDDDVGGPAPLAEMSLDEDRMRMSDSDDEGGATPPTGEMLGRTFSDSDEEWTGVKVQAPPAPPKAINDNNEDVLGPAPPTQEVLHDERTRVSESDLDSTTTTDNSNTSETGTATPTTPVMKVTNGMVRDDEYLEMIPGTPDTTSGMK